MTGREDVDVTTDGGDRVSEPPWLAALEGFYGPPLDAGAREELVRWLPSQGYDAFVYSPKDDPYQRARWREPYPESGVAELERLADVCADAGIELGLTISPGLDWRYGDAGEIDTLTAKVAQLLATGASSIGIAWDDVPGDGATIGREHGSAVASVAERLDAPEVRWTTCPVDYALDTPTEYLRAFSDAVGDRVGLIWTGPSVVTPRLQADHVRHLASSLGRRLLYAENFPVNDLGMAGVLHLGPYPPHEPEAMAAVDGVLVNFMSLPLASRVGLAVAARAWRDPSADRGAAWAEVIESHPGLRPLALACRSWLDEPGPDPVLRQWADAAGPEDHRLRDFLNEGCRADLDPALAAEVEPWLAAWEGEAAVMARALDIVETGAPPTFEATAHLALALRSTRHRVHQAFGTRWAIYPSTRRDEGTLFARPDAVVDRPNLTDALVARVLGTDAEDFSADDVENAEGAPS